jgi:type IV secretion system protein VirB10
MRLAMKLPGAKTGLAANEDDPREGMSAEVIELAGRNAYPTVTQREGKSDSLGLAAGVAVVALLGAVTLWSMDNARNAAPEASPQQQQAAGQASAPPPAQQAGAQAQAQPARNGAQTNPASRPGPAPRPVLAAPPAIAAGPRANPYSSPTVIFDGSSLPSAGTVVAAGSASAAGQAGQGSNGASGSAGDFASKIGGIGGGPTQAARTFDPQTTITQGTLIPAVLETAIDTDVPGFVRAVVSQDVRSYDGRRVLVPRSSRLIGQYQSGLQQGQKRAYVIWTRLIRPDGVSVDIASPATDFAGTGGLPGKVDNHFFKRFGSAMLLSVVGGLAAVASGGSSLVLGGGQSAAATALQQDGNIGPTVRVRQGEPIRVFTARDLDFSGVAAN